MISSRNVYILIILLSIFSCKKEIKNKIKKEQLVEVSVDSLIQKQPAIIKIKDSLYSDNNVKIDSVSINEIKTYINEELPTIFDYYYQEKIEEYSNWSNKLFGRCCSNTDLTFTENLYFKITSNIDTKKHPISNISDSQL